MGEWGSYGLSDFLLFSPQTYFRQFARLNEATFPLPLLLIALALAAALLAGSRRIWLRRAAVLASALLWASSAWLFHHRSYADINWAADRFALGFAVQAAVLVLVAFAGPMPSRHPSPVAQALAIAVAVLYPLQALAFGRAWQEAEIVGFSPDATALFTLFVAAAIGGGARWMLLPLALLWCAIGLLTLWTMGAPEFWSLAALALAAMAAIGTTGRGQRQG
ncbi:MAG: DUF6064 family protein [Reyranellaceae bacterium]